MRIYDRQAGSAAVVAIIGVIIIAVAGFAGYTVVHHKNDQTAAMTPAPAKTAATASTASGSDDASLQSNLQDINSSMNKESSDSAGTDAALNDQKNEVQVPTE